jgi:hypothetical protein
LDTAFSLVNTTKYPMSLQFVLMTIGPALLFLVWLGQRRLPGTDWLEQLGRTPFFYYAAHLYALHLLAWGAALAAGFPLAEFDVTARFGGVPEGFGFPLWTTIPFALGTAWLLLPLCRSYEARRQRYSWLRYF